MAPCYSLPTADRRDRKSGPKCAVQLGAGLQLLVAMLTNGYLPTTGGSQRPHLNGVNIGGVPSLGARVELTEAIAGDDEDDGGGAEGHLFLGPGACAARPGRNNGPDGALRQGERRLCGAALQPGQGAAEQLQQTAAELWAKRDRKLSRGLRRPPKTNELASISSVSLVPWMRSRDRHRHCRTESDPSGC